MNYNDMDDEAFVRYLRKHPNDEEGWKGLLERYHRLIWSRIPYRDTNAEDLYQEIQFAIWDGLLNRYGGEGTVLSYVGGIIANKVKGRSRIQLKESLAEEPDEDIAGNIPDPRANPAQQTIQKEAGSKTEELLQRLKLKEKKMAILRYLGQGHKEICQILNIRSEGASRKFLNKLIKKIKTHCEQLGIDPDQFREGMQSLFEEGKHHEILSQ